MDVTGFFSGLVQKFSGLKPNSKISSKGARGSPDSVLGFPPIQDEGKDWQKRGGIYRRHFIVDDLPKVVEAGWYYSVMESLPPNVFSSLSMDPIEQEELNEEMKRRSSALYSEKCRLEHNGLETNRNIRELGRLHRSITEISNTKYFRLLIILEVQDCSKEGLESTTAYLESIAEEKDFVLEPVRERQNDALRAVGLFDPKKIEYRTVVTAEALGAIALPTINPRV